MSELSSLSHEYASTADFSRAINDDVLFLKKRFLHGAVGVDEGQIAKASERLGQVLAGLLHRLGEHEIIATSNVIIPEDVVVRLESEHCGDRAFFISDLTRLVRELCAHAPLQQGELQLLDSICEAADASASATFRKLWRR
jgi:hypothetical protein